MISPKFSQEKEGIDPHRGAQWGASWGHFRCLWTSLSVVTIFPGTKLVPHPEDREAGTLANL